MKYVATGLLMLWVLAAGNCLAQDLPCRAAPHKDTQENYDAILSAYSRASQSLSKLAQSYFIGQVNGVMASACEVKFEAGDRTEFYRYGISDQEIDADGTAALANAWFAARSKLVANGSIAKQPWDFLKNPPWEGATKSVEGNAVLNWVLVGIARNQSGWFSFPLGLYSTAARCEEARKSQQASISPDLQGLKCSTLVLDRAPSR